MTAAVKINDIPTLERLAKHSAKQVALIDAMLKQAEDVDPVYDLTITESGTVRCDCVRTDLIALMTKARAAQQRQLAYYENTLESVRSS
jgi:hypothetical protein